MNNNSSQVVLVKDNTPGFVDNGYAVNPNSSDPRSLTEFDGKLYYTANDSESGRELWVSDGTEAGTNLVKDINPNSNSFTYGSDYSAPRYLTEFNSKLYFSAGDGEHGRELWVTDGTEAGTNLVKDINPSNDSDGNTYPSEPRDFTEAGDKLYFTADDGEHGRELWVTDGTAEGTNLVKDLYPGGGSYGANSSSPDDFVEFDGKLYFTANTETGRQQWGQ